MITRPITRPITSPIARAVNAAYGAWNPRALFKAGELGIWYDPNDLSTLFQDAAGTIPVTGVGQPVGRMLDKSGRGNHATQTLAAARPMLRQNATTGAYYLEFDGADDYLLVAGKSAYRFLHDGTGATVFVGFKPSGGAVYHALLNTGNLGSASVVGFAMSQDDRTTGVANNTIANGGGTLHANQNPASPVSANARVMVARNKASTHILTRDSVVLSGSATETGSPAAGDSTNDLWIGRAPAGFPAAIHLYGLTIVSRLPSASELIAEQRRMARLMGVTIA